MAGKWPSHHSIRGRLIYYNALLFALILAMAALLALMGEAFLRLPQELTGRHELLNSFYESVQEMDGHARSYLYTRSPEERAAFEQGWSDSHALLGELSRQFDAREDSWLQWRISLLDNMILTYRETLDKLETLSVGTAPYSRAYDFLFSTAQNIDRTRNEYSRLLTQRMAQSVRRIKDAWRGLLTAVLVALAAVLGLCLAYSAATVRGITLPLQKLVRNIHKIKRGQYDLKAVNTYGYQELDVLCNAFTDMAGSLRGYIQSLEENARLETRLLEKDNENLRISELLAKTELHSLQAQMNPHFLFNTLSMLSKLAYIEGASQSSEMMNTVADLMRYSLDKSSKASDLEGEMECLRNYIAIQNRRFGERITFRIAADPNVNNVIMPGMVLQPLVENAIMHGVSSMPRDALIEVKIYCDPRDIYLEVIDNGAGIPPEQLRRIFAGEDPSPARRHASIGLQNVLRRLNLFFGERYRVLVLSEPGCGTDVIITLPRAAQEEEAHD